MYLSKGQGRVQDGGDDHSLSCVAILVAIGMFRASGALDVLTGWVESCVAWLGFDTQWVGALPTMLMKPLSGSGSCAMMLDVMKANGADAFCQQTCGSRAWLNRHNILYTRSLFRIGRSDQDPLCRRLCTPCGPHRSCRGSGGGLLLLLTVASASLTRTASG